MRTVALIASIDAMDGERHDAAIVEPRREERRAEWAGLCRPEKCSESCREMRHECSVSIALDVPMACPPITPARAPSPSRAPRLIERSRDFPSRALARIQPRS